MSWLLLVLLWLTNVWIFQNKAKILYVMLYKYKWFKPYDHSIHEIEFKLIIKTSLWWNIVERNKKKQKTKNQEKKNNLKFHLSIIGCKKRHIIHSVWQIERERKKTWIISVGVCCEMIKNKRKKKEWQMKIGNEEIYFAPHYYLRLIHLSFE